jgi:hypothetical protein
MIDFFLYGPIPFPTNIFGFFQDILMKPSFQFLENSCNRQLCAENCRLSVRKLATVRLIIVNQHLKTVSYVAFFAFCLQIVSFSPQNFQLRTR